MGILLEKLPQSLQDVLESEGELDFHEKIYIVTQIIQGLAFLHESSAFCCLRSEFIFLDDSLEIVKLLPRDKNLQDQNVGRLFLNAETYQKTIEGELIPPEFFENSKSFFKRTKEQDLWDLGLLLYEMFSKNETSEKEMKEIIKIKNSEQKLFLYSKWSESLEINQDSQSSNEIKNIMRKCLNIRKDERISAEEILEIIGKPLI